LKTAVGNASRTRQTLNIGMGAQRNGHYVRNTMVQVWRCVPKMEMFSVR